MKKLVLFSGIQPSGNLTIGNYISILKKINIFQKKYKCILCIADLHSMSKYINPILLRKNILDLLSIIISSNIDYKYNIIFTQSSILEHTQLYWILSSLVKFNKLKNLNQFKEKIINKNNDINLNMLSYPILMASDILLYNTDIILVGKDQKQHTEIIKLIINKFNNIYSNIFKIPLIKIYDNNFIMSLLNVNKKMSKTDINNNNIINILDNDDHIKEKIKKSITDSDNPPNIIYNKLYKPGISNLLNILSSIKNCSIEYLLNYFKNKSYSFLKDEVSNHIIKEFRTIKNKYYDIRCNEDFLEKILKYGSIKAKKIAKNNFIKVKKVIGLYKLNN